MKRKKITTKSGAEYVVYEDGDVLRRRGDHDMERTVDDYQYVCGFLQAGISYDSVSVGARLPWMGVRFDKFTETILSSVIVSVEEVEE